MIINRILCPIDFSEFSNAAIDFASDLAQTHDATIVFVHAVTAPLHYSGSHTSDPIGRDIDEVRQALEQLRPASECIPFEHHLIHGYEADVIVEFANENDIDLIVVGTHGRTGLLRMLFGSVAEQIVRRAKCPVVALKLSAPEPIRTD